MAIASIATLASADLEARIAALERELQALKIAVVLASEVVPGSAGTGPAAGGELILGEKRLEDGRRGDMLRLQSAARYAF